MRRAAAIAVLALVAAGCGGSGKGYSLTLPSGWHQIKPAPAGVVAAYERNDATSYLTIRKDSRVPVVSSKFIHRLDVEFGKRLKGYTPLTAQIVTTGAGPVFFFAYTQKNVGRLTSIVLVPGHDSSYVLDFVNDPRSKAAQQDMASIIHTFKPQ